MLLALLKQANFHPEKTRSLKVVSLGGTIVSPGIVDAITDADSIGAADAIVAFGMTEGLPVCGASTKGGVPIHREMVSMGKPLPGVRLKICQHQSRRTLARGQIGELHFGGDLLIQGYLYSDDQVFYEDHQGHWIATKDEAMMDGQGDIFILGRDKDIIICGGENLSPALIENCFAQAGVVIRLHHPEQVHTCDWHLFPGTSDWYPWWYCRRSPRHSDTDAWERINPK